MREHIQKGKEFNIISRSIDNASRCCVTETGDDCFKVKLGLPSEYEIGESVELFAMTSKGQLYFETFIKEVDGDVLSIWYPIIFKYLQRREYSRVKSDKTITLSVGQLTVGVTIPEWSGVLMLCNMKSPSSYMQAAFRAQNPCILTRNGLRYRKETAYVFDFDPARTLIIFEEFANDLSSGTSGGKGDSDQRKQNVRELLNFFPVIGEDENGEMIELDAEKVLSIPRRIKSREVVKSGFMNNYLFTDALGVIFHAPQELIDIGLSVPQSTAIAMALREKGMQLEGSVFTHEQLLRAIAKAKGVALC
mgnify:CR=1 FL=1